MMTNIPVEVKELEEVPKRTEEGHDCFVTQLTPTE